MSKKRILLVTIILILVIATVAFFVSGFFKKVDAPLTPSTKTEQKQPAVSQDTLETIQNVLEPLPADNKTAIESELSNIDKEINSAIDTDLSDLSDIEESL